MKLLRKTKKVLRIVTWKCNSIMEISKLCFVIIRADNEHARNSVLMFKFC